MSSGKANSHLQKKQRQTIKLDRDTGAGLSITIIIENRYHQRILEAAVLFGKDKQFLLVEKHSNNH